ncbi:MAG: diguanylate cyclase, partial [bacterium]|nr:diguanylate cyclase [bacterium]
MTEKADFIQKIGSWAAEHQKATLFIIFFSVVYGFFHFGIDSTSWLVIVLRIVTLLFLLLLIFSPLKIKYPEKTPELQADSETLQEEDVIDEVEEEEKKSEQKIDLFGRDSIDKDKEYRLLMNRVLGIVKNTFVANSAALFMLNENNDSIVLSEIVSENDSSGDHKDFSADRGIIGRTLDNDNFLSNDPEELKNLIDYHGDELILKSALASIVRIDDKIEGVLIVDSIEKNAYSDDDLKLIESYTSLISHTIENFRNLFDFENSAKFYSFLYELNKGLNSNLSYEEIIDLLFDTLRKMFEYDRLTVSEYTREANTAKIIKVDGQVDDFPEGTVYKVEEGVSGWVINVQKNLNLKDMEEGEFFRPRYSKEEKTNFGLRSFLGVPLTFNEISYGMVSLESKIPDMYTERHELILQMLTGNFTAVIDRSTTLKQFEKLATTDGLTKLFNFRSFTHKIKEEANRAARYNLKFTLFMLDLDDFKRINTLHGHSAGNKVLVEVAGAISRTVRNVDFVYRYGGEEFAIILVETGMEKAMGT